MIKPPPSVSPFAARSAFYLDNGLSIVPIAPGTKRPGAYSGGQWHGMKDWGKFATIMPSGWQIDAWSQWPDAGIGLLCGKLSGVVAVDIDTDDLALIGQIADVIGGSPVKKKGKKGLTAFYRYNGEVPHSWDVNKQRVVDLLSTGRQTLMPGTQHPDGMSYYYLTDDTLEEFDLSQLPTLPATVYADLDALFAPMQTAEDRAARRDKAPPRDDSEIPQAFQSIASQLWKTINQTALDRLDDWVPNLISSAKPHGAGYRCRAYWRGAANPNVGINPSGIRDFGQGVGLTPIDLVMHATGSTFAQAEKALRDALGLNGSNTPKITASSDESRANEEGVDLSKILAQLPPPPRPAIPMPPSGPRANVDPMVAAHEKRERERLEEQQEQASHLPEFIANAPGLIGEIADWINATSPKPQPEFAVVAALTIGATVMGRRYVTDRNNFPSMGYLIMADSGEGKDHPQKAVRKVLDAAGLGRMIGGSGYTSAGAVFTALMIQPSHVAIIDEFGQHLKSLGKNGSQNSDAAMTSLMISFTNVDSSIRPQTYSAMSMSKKDMASLEDKTIHNPAITLLCATTPGVFFGALKDDQLEGGLLNRFVLVQTNEPIRVSRKPLRLPVPDSAVQWCNEVLDEHNATGDLRDANANDASVPARPVEMFFEAEAEALYDSFEREIVQRRRELDAFGRNLLVRTAEKALRVAMVVAKMTNAPRDNQITAEALRWAIKYVKHYDYRTVAAVETQRPQSKIEARLLDVEKFMKRTTQYKDAAYLKVTQTGAMPHALLLKKMKVDSREMALIMQTAVDTGLVHKQTGLPDVGFAGDVYYLRGLPD
jgi:hypothetical protein